MKICIIYPYKNTTKKNLDFYSRICFLRGFVDVTLHNSDWNANNSENSQKHKKIFQLIYNKQNHTKKKKPEYDDAKRNHKQSLKAKKWNCLLLSVL